MGGWLGYDSARMMYVVGSLVSVVSLPLCRRCRRLLGEEWGACNAIGGKGTIASSLRFFLVRGRRHCPSSGLSVCSTSSSLSATFSQPKQTPLHARFFVINTFS